MKHATIAFLLVFSFFSMECKKEDSQPVIPEVYVNFVINPNTTEYIELNAPGGWVYLTGGYRGILVYRLSMTEFLAYERTCPWDPSATGSRIEVDESGIICVCPVCHSTYSILDGIPNGGPSTYLLKQYRTTYANELLYVYN